MITVSEARIIIDSLTVRMLPVKLPLKKVTGLVLVKDVFASADIPAFAQSAVDGYAIRFDEINLPLTFNGTMPAGADKELMLLPGQAIRIFTGAPLPAGADTVIMQEQVNLQNNIVSVENKSLVKGANVRVKGSEIRVGELAMNAANTLTPAAIGFLANIGVAEVIIYPLPLVSVIITGNELQKPGSPLQYGQVYDANSFQLSAALRQAGITDAIIREVKDDLKEIQQALFDALETSDIVLLTGGVSVGDYDFVVEAANACGVDNHFHKIKQRPGKPLYFGTKGPKAVFGLPGNPSSVLVCFYQYVLPCLEAMSGKTNSIKVKTMMLGTDYKKIKGLTVFLKGHCNDKTVIPLTAQESFRLSSFAQANCLIELEESREEYKKGEMVIVHLLPG